MIWENIQVSTCTRKRAAKCEEAKTHSSSTNLAGPLLHYTFLGPSRVALTCRNKFADYKQSRRPLILGKGRFIWSPK